MCPAGERYLALNIAIVQAATNTSSALGNERWGLGADSRDPEAAEGQSVGLWRAREQRVVGEQFRQLAKLQQFPDAAHLSTTTFPAASVTSSTSARCR